MSSVSWDATSAGARASTGLMRVKSHLGILTADTQHIMRRRRSESGSAAVLMPASPDSVKGARTSLSRILPRAWHASSPDSLASSHTAATSAPASGLAASTDRPSEVRIQCSSSSSALTCLAAAEACSMPSRDSTDSQAAGVGACARGLR
jgi:hypothetical protein